MLTNWNASKKTKRPACCDFDCCGCHFGRFERRQHTNKGANRIIAARRYAKRSEKNRLKLEILREIEDLKDFEFFDEDFFGPEVIY